MDKMLSVVLPAYNEEQDDQENSTGGRRPA